MANGWLGDILGYKEVSVEGVALARRAKLNLINVTGTDNPVTGTTDLTFTPPDAIGTSILTSDLPAGVDGQIIVASGRDAFGDGGGGLIVFDESSSATPDDATVWQVGGLPGRWERVTDGKHYNVLWYGARTDLTPASSALLQTANVTAFQACIDACVAAGAGVVVVPAGRYVINACIHLAKVTSGLCSLTFRGDGYAYAGESGFGGTSIIATHSNQPAVNVQGARGVIVEGFAFRGPSYDWIQSHNLANTSPTLDDTVAANWNDPALHANADSQTAPSCAIAIDGWSSAASAAAYPTTYSSYSRAASSDVVIRDCYFTGWNTGIVVQPNDASPGNADFVVFERLNFEYVKYGLSFTGTQSRQPAMHRCKFNLTYCALTNMTHGDQQGRINGTIDDLHVGASIMVFQLGTTSTGGAVTFTNLYCEALWRIGDIYSTGSTETSVEFISPHIEFQNQTEARGIPATVLGGASQPLSVSFRGGFIGGYESVVGFTHQGLRFDGTMFSSLARELGPAKTYLATFHNTTCDGVIFPLFNTDEQHRIKFTQCNIDTLGMTGGNTVMTARTKKSDRARCIPAWTTSCAALSDNARDDIPVPVRIIAVDKASLTSATLLQSASERGRLTLVFTSLPAADAEINGMAPGDAIYDASSKMVFVIRSRTTTTVIAEAQNNYKLSSGAYTTITAFSTTVGFLYFLNCRIYTPTWPVLADLTSGSPTLAAAGRDGTNDLAAADIAVDDRAYVNDYRDRWVDPLASKVTAVGATIVLDSNVNRTEGRKRLPLFVRKPPANEAAR